MLSPPRLSAPAGADALSLQWDALPGASSYTLLTDDWWSGTQSLSLPVSCGEATAFTLAERVVPGTPTTLLLLASDDHNELARSEPITYTAAERGACGNAPDATVWRDNSQHLRGDVTACLEECSLSGAECTEACVQKRYHFSQTCGSCWAAYYDCAEAHCAMACGLSPKSAKCHACTESACTPGGIACTGMPPWTWKQEAASGSE